MGQIRMHRAGLIGLALFLGCGRLAAEPPVQSFDVDVPAAPVPVTSEARELLVYELHLTSFADGPLALKSVRVLDADGASVLATFAGDDLVGRSKIVGAPTSAKIEPGRRAIVFVELGLPPGASVRALAHEIGFETPEGTSRTLTPSRVAVRASEVPRLGPPLHGGPWVAVHDPRWPRGHRRVFYTIDGEAKLPGRFAVDWVGADDSGAVTHGNPDRPADAIGYGADVLAGADATVAAMRDGMTESDSIKGNPAHALGDGAGNYVVLQVAPDRYAFYEHLRPGSIRVRAGERVRRGQVIGALGFSGDTTGPHLHLNVADCADPLACEGTPFVIEGMHELGRYDDAGDLGRKPWRTAERTAIEWPGRNVVVRFR